MVTAPTLDARRGLRIQRQQLLLATAQRAARPVVCRRKPAR
jgi:hypothetical protein